jgi:hypothetical protein
MLFPNPDKPEKKNHEITKLRKDENVKKICNNFRVFMVKNFFAHLVGHRIGYCLMGISLFGGIRKRLTTFGLDSDNNNRAPGHSL